MMSHLPREEPEEPEPKPPLGDSPGLPISAYRLPAGVHGLSRRYVRENQRWRLAAAAAELLQEIGYQRLTMRAIAARAAVAPSVAYDAFPDPAAILAGAFELAAAGLRERLRGPCKELAQGNHATAALDAISRSFAAPHEVATLFDWEAMAASAELASARLELLDEFVSCLSRTHGLATGPAVEITRLRLEGALVLLARAAHEGRVIGGEELATLTGIEAL